MFNTGVKGDPFIVYRLAGSALFVLAIALFSQTNLRVDIPSMGLGVHAGFLLGAFMWLIGKSVDTGPAALTFACISSSAVVPPLLMALIFGQAYGHGYTMHHGLGALLVVVGLFTMASYDKKTWSNRVWARYAFLAFASHSLLLCVFQWRALMCQVGLPPSVLLPFSCSTEATEGMPLAMFATATLMQMGGKGSKGTNIPFWPILVFGVLGGAINGFGNWCLIKGTEVAASSTQKALLFPLFSVWLIFCCNLWGRYFYSEKIHWPGSIICFAGIFVSLM